MSDGRMFWRVEHLTEHDEVVATFSDSMLAGLCKMPLYRGAARRRYYLAHDADGLLSFAAVGENGGMPDSFGYGETAVPTACKAEAFKVHAEALAAIRSEKIGE